MSVTGERLPGARYGRAAEARTDRRLKAVGSVLGVALLALVGWFGYDYVTGQKVSAEMIKFDVVAADRVDVHLEVRTADGAKGYCTVRALSEDRTEVGRRDFRFDRAAPRLDEVVVLRTTRRATAAQLVGCSSD
ncbi:DUF4307 domain-containing protein [Streptomyces sudanensis]|uniref:DUF4307 domain-containing protein n=1 Tax=Streptomyces sudanensis TaxID=436397 RepID=UPI0020CF7A89|nr:DUF4307 domain-containing protein [Streptomyces sudanensis]MCP9957550.1 DUF4307 domain-containing protein [Streptomyces sudanensis]MCQ0001908.1 DUF4307 domain-containing protein [Streptomyces sudanensis]